LLAVIRTEQVHLLILVTSGNEFLEPELLKVEREVVKEVADSRVVAVQIHNLVSKVFAVMLQLTFDVGELGVELVLFCGAGIPETGVVVVLSSDCHEPSPDEARRWPSAHEDR
jgi:hypothetical protein